MQRWQIQSLGADKLELVTVEKPSPAPGEILVKVEAVSLNYRDAQIIANGMGENITFPFSPASDMAGIVTEVGDGVTRFAVGDRVITAFVTGWIDGAPPRWNDAPLRGAPLPGVLSEFICVTAEWCVHAPARLSPAQASTLPTAGLTAWTALIELGHLRAGHTVVTQGTGGVSLFAAQLGLAHGADVIVTTSSKAKLARLKAIGEIKGLRRGDDWHEQVLHLTAGRGADHILEMAGGDNLARSLAAITPGGRISMIGLLDALHFTAPTPMIIASRATIAGIAVGSRRGLEDLVRAVDRIHLQPVIDTTYPFAQAPKAFDHVQNGAFGKVVIEISAD